MVLWGEWAGFRCGGYRVTSYTDTSQQNPLWVGRDDLGLVLMYDEGMTTDNLPNSAVSVLMALLFALLFATTFFWEYSPERLLAQILLSALAIDGLRPLLSKLKVGIIHTISGIAYFAPRVVVLIAIFSWFFDNLPKMVSTAMSHNGWEFAFGVGYVVLVVLVVSLAFLMILFGIGYSVWDDAFGRKAQDGEQPR